jgi:hypothetical protein
MGWDSSREWQSAQDVKAAMIRDFTGDGRRVLAHGGQGKEFYLALENSETNQRGIVLCLIERWEGEYGVKIIAETGHPYYYACPDKVLKAAGPPKYESSEAQKRAEDWRAEVARQKARAKRKFNTGDKVIVNGRPHTIVNPTWTKTFATVRDEQGGLWKTRIQNIELA